MGGLRLRRRASHVLRAVIASIMAGAAGYLLKDADAEKLIEGIEAIARGGSLLDPAVTQTVLSWMQRPSV
jgi:DNA-binding NarL/FixJ family response regulator